MALEDEIIGVPRREIEELRQKVIDLTNQVIYLTRVQADAQELLDQIEQVPPGRLHGLAEKATVKLKRSMDPDAPRPGKGTPPPTPPTPPSNGHGNGPGNGPGNTPTPPAVPPAVPPATPPVTPPVVTPPAPPSPPKPPAGGGKKT